jgi:SAM-dependent methyltransferase
VRGGEVVTDAWEEHAAWWQDGFTDGADPEYEEQMIPMARTYVGGAQRILDIGTGEGQVARAVAADDPKRVVVGIDPAWNQIRAARERAGGPVFGRASATALPFAAGAFDAAIACLVFEHIHAADDALAEVARVLRPGGRFLFFLNHPLLQTPGSGWIDDQILGEQYWRVGPYLQPDFRLEEIAPGVELPYVHRPLSHYVNLMFDVGLSIVRMEEPPPPPGFIALATEYEEAASIPRLLFLLAERQ